MGILDVKIVQDYIRMCTDGWEQGWHERNGGNLTYRMQPEEVEQCRLYFRTAGEWAVSYTHLAESCGEYGVDVGEPPAGCPAYQSGDDLSLIHI